MNEPIVNPWIFYFLNVLRNVNTVLLICFILLAACGAVGMAIFIAISEYEREQYIDKGKSFGRAAVGKCKKGNCRKIGIVRRQSHVHNWTNRPSHC